ncbi:MAG: c-type cytochrome [Alphaproteobacteria bacterium]|nr:c-type cytochrome [Alphaproteobacteria bacterium]
MRFSWKFMGMLVAGAVALTSTTASAAEDASSIARGGRLYDKYWGENKTAKPETNHQSFANKAGKYDKDASWRCKECHGWDYKGKDGAYGSGGHMTGIVGIQGAAGKDPAAIIAIMKDKTHGYTEAQLAAQDMKDLAMFVSKGQVDMTKYIDYAAKKAKGDAAKGEGYYNTICANCHGLDGKKINNAPPLGSLQNPQEMLHKVLNGQPGQNMPALRLLDPQISVDLVAHMLTLPQQ